MKLPANPPQPNHKRQRRTAGQRKARHTRLPQPRYIARTKRPAGLLDPIAGES